jgi:hypothetical protein
MSAFLQAFNAPTASFKEKHYEIPDQPITDVSAKFNRAYKEQY